MKLEELIEMAGSFDPDDVDQVVAAVDAALDQPMSEEEYDLIFLDNWELGSNKDQIVKAIMKSRRSGGLRSEHPSVPDDYSDDYYGS